MKPRFPFLAAASLLLAACASAPVPTVLLDPPSVVQDPQNFPLPYAEVEAETGRTTGSYSPFTTGIYDPGSEASGRRYVTLPPGARLVLTSPVDADSLVARWSYPDGAPDGTLSVSIGTAAPLSLLLTSKYSWEYGRPSWGSDNVWRESGGSPRHFWDESHLRTPAFAAGTEVVLTNPAASKVEVLVDLVDFELVPPAVAAPAGSLSFADFLPDATGKTDVTDLFQKALDKAKGGVLFVPEGTYRIGTVYVPAVTVQGAGLWRTRFVGPLSQFRFQGRTCRLSDLAVFGETNLRNDSTDEENGLAGNPGPGSTVERVWIEHKKCAYWVGNWGSKTPVTGLTLAGCRFRNLMADAVNLCSGTNNSVVQNCLVRNSGDDALAAWSPRNGGPAGGSNTFRANLIQSPWVASGIALYGGGPFLVEGNLVKDTVTTGSGIYLSANFGAWPFQGKIEVRDNLLVRCGAHESDPGGPTGALRLVAGDLTMATGEYLFTDNTVVNPLEYAVSISGPRSLGSATFRGLAVKDLSAATQVLSLRPNASGTVTFTGVTVEGQNTDAAKEFPGGSLERSF